MQALFFVELYVIFPLKGDVNWSNLQFTENYDGQKVKFHTSRLNDLLGRHFTESFPQKIGYILYNPWTVKSEGTLKASNSRIKNVFTKFIYNFIRKSPKEAMVPLIKRIDENNKSGLFAYKLDAQ